MNKTIWMCWFQGEADPNIPKLNKKCIKRWRELNPDWDVKVLCSETIKKYVPEFDEIVKDSPQRTWQAKSDLVRVLLLSKYGGVWVDASVFPMIPLSDYYNKIVNETGFFTYRFLPRMTKMGNGLPCGKETVSWFLCVKSPNNYLIRRWKQAFVNRFKNFKNWPYFTFHETLCDLYDKDPKIKKIIDKMVQISEKIPHSAIAKWNRRKESYLYKRPKLPTYKLEIITEVNKKFEELSFCNFKPKTTTLERENKGYLSFFAKNNRGNVDLNLISEFRKNESLFNKTEKQTISEENHSKNKKENVLILDSWFPKNYCHTLFDFMPNFFSRISKNYDLIIVSKTEARNKILNTINFPMPKNVKFLEDGEEIRVDCDRAKIEYFYASRDPQNVSFFKEKILENFLLKNIDQKRNKFIYCSRNSPEAKHGRRMNQYNEDEIIKICSSFCEKRNLDFVVYNGCKKNSREAMEILDQVKLFNSAKIIIGPHGGALSNVIFTDQLNEVSICEFVGGENSSFQNPECFSKNYNSLWANQISTFSNYYLIPFESKSNKEESFIKILNLKKFLNKFEQSVY